MASHCKHEGCDRVLGRQNKSGFCKRHFSQNCMTPEHAANIRAGQKRRMMNPEQRAAAQARARAIFDLPQSRETRRRNAVEGRLWEKALAAVTPEHRKLAGLRSRATKLAWCPPELRDEYMALIRRKRVKAVEARRIILEQHEIEMARWRREIGAPKVIPVVEPVQQFVPSGRDYQDERMVKSVAAAKAERARVDALRVRRDSCPLCGVRGDIGCEHREAA